MPMGKFVGWLVSEQDVDKRCIKFVISSSSYVSPYKLRRRRISEIMHNYRLQPTGYNTITYTSVQTYMHICIAHIYSSDNQKASHYFMTFFLWVLVNSCSDGKASIGILVFLHYIGELWKLCILVHEHLHTFTSTEEYLQETVGRKRFYCPTEEN